MKTCTLEELRLAQAKGCRIEYCDVDDGDWFVVGGDFAEKMSKAAAYKFRIHPADEWKAKLPRLREGAEWCCDGNGYEKARPHIVGETLKKDNVFGRANKGCRIMTTAPVPPEFLHPDELKQQWCPMCAAWTDHGSGACPQLVDATPSTPAPDYGEPWNKEIYNTELGNTGDYEGHLEIFDRNNGRRVAECCNPDDENEADFDRIIACVNSMAGVPDPAAFVRQAMEMKEAIKEAHEALSTCWTAHKRSHREELLQGYNQNMVEASISKLELFLP